MNKKFFKIDKRSKDDIINDIKTLSESYTPEWIYNLNDADAGSVIASIYADMLEDDVNKLNMVMYKYRIELMNIIGLTLKPAKPAESVVKFSLLPTAVGGTYVSQKTKLVATGNNGDKIIFETQNSMYVTDSKIADIYTTSRIYGKIINLMDSIKYDKTNKKSFYLFDYSNDGQQRNELVIGHSYGLNLNKNAVLMLEFSNKFEDDNLAEKLANMNQYEWNYLTSDGFKKFDKVECKDRKLYLHKNENSEKIHFKDVYQYYISVKQKDSKITDVISIDDIKIISSCCDVVPEIVYQGDCQVDPLDFYPFGDRLAVYDECYFAADDIFSKKGSLITLKFDISYSKNIIEIEYKEDIDYKVVMKRPKQTIYEMEDAKAENIIFEYFNGVGWAKLELDDNYSSLLAGENVGEVVLQFICPDDINKIAVNAYFRYWIRIRLLKADNCYRIPCQHIVPIIKNLKLSYRYSQGVTPDYLLSYNGVAEREITNFIKKKESVEIFKPVQYQNNSLFLGFDKKFIGGPINIYFDIEGSIKKEKDNIKFEYFCIENNDFRFLKIIDGTENFRHSGSVIFIPPIDMGKYEIFNKERYWIKITDEMNLQTNLRCLKINDIIINAVEVKNIENKDPEVFYIDQATPNMKFQLSYKDILYADVFVNEINSISIEKMDEMVNKFPNEVIAQHDLVGNYVSFFVKWHEVDTFVKSGPNDRHYVLDRSNGVIKFGDSIKGKIPSKQIKEAIKVFAVGCNGENGNVEEGMINKTDTIIDFVKSVNNDVPAYSGHDIEKIDNSLDRGANIINSYNRLVSERDFEKAVLSFSCEINKVKCASCIDEYGNFQPEAVTIAVLIKEFDKNSGAFYAIKNKIKEDLMEHCEITLREENLNIIEPTFVEVCVDVWINVEDYNVSFEVKNKILNYLNLFIDPINGNFHNEGWDIGKLPKDMQIYSFLKSKNTGALIEKIIITGKIKNIDQIIEKEINDFSNNQFVIGVNGKHNVFVNFSQSQSNFS